MHIHQWLVIRAPIHETFYDILVSTAGCGAFDGGCLVVARALQRVIGGKLVVLTRADDTADHAAIEIDGKLWDYDGPLTPRHFINRFNRTEMRHTPFSCIGYRDIRDGDLPNAVRDDALETKLAAVFATALSHGPNRPAI